MLSAVKKLIACLPLAIAFLVACSASAAHAASVHIATEDGEQVLHYDADPGEYNSLGFSLLDGGGLQVLDSASITTGSGCGPADPPQDHRVYCAEPEIDKLVISLGDMNDALHSPSFDAPPIEANGGPGSDQFNTRSGDEKLEGGEGDDMFDAWISGEDSDDFAGGPGDDWIYYGNRQEPLTITLDGLPGDGAAGENDNVHADVDQVYSGTANDLIQGGPGDELLHGGSGDDVIDGGAGEDTLDGGAICEHDELHGGDDADLLLFKSTGSLFGDGGDDVIRFDGSWCGPPEDVGGGPGTDTLDLHFLPVEVSISLDDVADDFGEGEAGNVHSDVENVFASDAGASLIGSPAANVLTGGNGDDLLAGRGGADVLTGGGGVDVADYSGLTAPLSLTLDGIANDGQAGENGSLAGVENLIGGAGPDTLLGNDGDNVLDGGPGADVIGGGDGLDAVDYFSRTDPVSVDLDGAAGDDGAAGEGDTVGADVEGAFGGLAADTLVGNAADGFLAGAEGNDTISDPGGEDLLSGEDGDDDVDSRDGVFDYVACDAGDDQLFNDQWDHFDQCEYVNVLRPKPIVPENPPAQPPLPLRPTDRSGPTSSLKPPKGQRLRQVRKHGLRLRVSCDEPCRLTAKLTALGKTRRALRRAGLRAAGKPLARGRRPGMAMGERTVTLTLTGVGRKAFELLSPKARFEVAMTATDRLGNRRTVRSAVTLRR